MPIEVRPRNRFRLEERLPTVARLLHVRSLEYPGDGIVRVVLHGPELGSFARNGTLFPAMTSNAFDDVVVLWFPDPDIKQPQLPTVGKNSEIIWPTDSNWHGREYTVRRYFPESLELVVDFILHETGPANAWVTNAVVHDPLVVIGPRISRAIPHEPHLLAIGDATAIPAIARLLEDVPATTTLDVYILAEEAMAGTYFAYRYVERVNWIKPIGDPLRVLSEALSETPLPDRSWAWVAGETSLVVGIRRLLVNTHRLDKDRIQFTGYWKQAESAFAEV